jgi:FlgD Ig-like domain
MTHTMKHAPLLALLLLVGMAGFAVAGDLHKPLQWNLQGDPVSKLTPSYLAGEINGIPSNSVIDLEIASPYIWLATGAGLGRFAPTLGAANPADGDWFVATHEDEGIGRGGVSAATATVTSWGQAVIWTATAFDSLAAGEDLATGGGVGFSLDDGVTWMWMEQPVDSLSETEFAPTVTPIQNVTYDIGIMNDRVWIVSWGGGIRYFDMFDGMHEADPSELVWVNRPPDDIPFNVLQQNNHRGFSAATMEEDSLLWIGTAAGINLSRDEGETWQSHKYSSQNDNTPCGDFVPALGAQVLDDGRHLLWAGCWVVSAESGQFYGVSVTDDEGVTWRRVLGSQDEPIRVHNFAFQDSIVYAATDDGLYKSADFGETWGLFPKPIDLNNGERFFDDQVYAAAYGFGRLWMGGPEGLGISDDGGNEWAIERTAPELSGKDDTYAFPNPFSPERFPVVRMRYTMPRPGDVTIEIYDFALDLLIRTVNSEHRSAGEHNDVWDGRDPTGGEIANGVYFYRVEGGGQERWGKILVMD